MCRYLLEASARNKAKGGVASHCAIPPEPPGAEVRWAWPGLRLAVRRPRLDQTQARDQAACRSE